MKLTEHIRTFGNAPSHLAMTARITRLMLLTFVVTFLLTRTIVYMITEKILFSFVMVGETHVHHLNFGIFLMSLVCLSLLLARPQHTGLYFATIGFGVALALTFDEFGMWLSLGGSYNNMLSFDAVIVIAFALALVTMTVTAETRHLRHWALAALVVALAGAFVLLGALVHRHGLMARAFTIQGL